MGKAFACNLARGVLEVFCQGLLLERTYRFGITCMRAAASQVVATALRGWALLLSILPGWHMSAPFVEASLGGLAKGLYSDAVEVREAAGEAIALLYDSAGLAELDDDSGASSSRHLSALCMDKARGGCKAVHARVKAGRLSS